MISTDKYFNPGIGNVESVAYGFISLGDVNKPLFSLPANSLITEIMINGPAFTIDGVDCPETQDQGITIGSIDDPDKFVALDSYVFGKNPINLWVNTGDTIDGNLGTGVEWESFFIGDTVVVGSYDAGSSGANGGGPLVVIVRYIKL